MAPEDLWAPARARRTLLMAVATLMIAAGAVVLAAALVAIRPFPPALWKSEGLAVGLLLFVVGVVALRYLVREGRKVGAVYGVKAAQRSGLLPPSPGERPRPPEDRR